MINQNPNLGLFKIKVDLHVFLQKTFNLMEMPQKYMYQEYCVKEVGSSKIPASEIVNVRLCLFAVDSRHDR